MISVAANPQRGQVIVESAIVGASRIQVADGQQSQAGKQPYNR